MGCMCDSTEFTFVIPENRWTRNWDNLHPKEMRVWFSQLQLKTRFLQFQKTDTQRDSELKLWKWVQNLERKKGGFGVQWWLMRFNHLVLKLHGEFDLIYCRREIVAEEISAEEHRGASKQASKRGPESLWSTKGVHGRNYCCGATTTTTTHSLLGKWPTVFSFDFEESMAPYQKKIFKLFLDDGFF
jgi:hypothetical protein